MYSINDEIERLIIKYGKEYESLIRDSIKFKYKLEKECNIKHDDISKSNDIFIEDLISHLVKDE
jgi:hypothetical protein